MFKRTKIILLLIVFLSIAFNLSAGWTQTYGGTDWDYASSVQQTTDGGYIVAGETDSYGAGLSDFYLIKTDENGDTTWIRTYGGSDNELANSVQQTDDWGYIIAGYTLSYGAGLSDFYLVKTDGNGDTIWTRTYGGSFNDYGVSVQQTSDGGYIITGITYSYGADSGDIYLVKTYGNGDTIWTRTYGGSSNDYGVSVQQTSDGGYIVAGVTESFGAGNSDIYLIKTDWNGNTIWTQTYGGSSYDAGVSVDQTSDGGYIIAGETSSYGAGSRNVYLIKTTINGDSIWTQTYGETGYAEASSVQQTSDGGYIVTGHIFLDVYLIKTTVNGDTIWTRTYGGAGEDVGKSVDQTSDGGYIIGGYTRSFGAGSGDVYLIKTDANGVVVVEETIISTPENFSYSISQISDNNITLQFSLPTSDRVQLNIYDVSGRHISTPIEGFYSSGIHNVNFKTDNSGVYFFSLKTEEFSENGKFIVF